MVTAKTIEDFLSSKRLAVVGVSRSGKKFGNSAMKELRSKGFMVYPVNSKADKIDGEKCYHSLNVLPEKVDGAVIVVPPDEAGKVVRDAAAAGIHKVWFQLGSQSKDSIRFCEENGMSAVHGECILMFTEPVNGFHKFHKTVKKVFGGLPK